MTTTFYRQLIRSEFGDGGEQDLLMCFLMQEQVHPQLQKNKDLIVKHQQSTILIIINIYCIVLL